MRAWLEEQQAIQQFMTWDIVTGAADDVRWIRETICARNVLREAADDVG